MVVEQFKKLWWAGGIDFVVGSKLSADHCRSLTELRLRHSMSAHLNLEPSSLPRDVHFERYG
jgi:hypothetical protein